MYDLELLGRKRAPALGQLSGCAAGKMIRPQGVLETGMGCSGIDQKRMAELTDVAKTLERLGINDGQRIGLQPDVAPEWVPDDSGVGGLHWWRLANREQRRINAGWT